MSRKTPLAAYHKRPDGTQETAINWDHIGREYLPPIEVDLDALPCRYRQHTQQHPRPTQGQDKNQQGTHNPTHKPTQEKPT